MGGGTWNCDTFRTYSKGVGRTVDNKGYTTTQNAYKARCMDDALNPYGVTRECCDSAEHPNTIPVILALDVTGSMGAACEKTVASLNVIMTNLYKKYRDVEFLIMGIGDLSYDISPVQASQFESDIRIAEQLDKLFLEKHGGGNSWESYTAAWFFGLHHTKLDCWNRGQKGVIITMGDEQLNPYLPSDKISRFLSDSMQADVNTPELYNEVTEKFDVFHISIDDYDCSYDYNNRDHDVDESWQLLGQHYSVSTIDGLPGRIEQCISASIERIPLANNTAVHGISW